MRPDDVVKILEQFIDLLMPDLTPHESSLYIFLFRHGYLKKGQSDVRMGQRTIAVKYGQGPKKSVPSRAHITRQLKMLEKKGCIIIGDTNRDGTLYKIMLPYEVPSVMKKLSNVIVKEDDDFYNDIEKRKLIYDRDQWKCKYCGEKVTPDSVTLDHFVPQCKGGSNKKENLRTSCLLCNSIKSGKTYEEAAIYLLANIQERRSKSS